MSWIFLFLGFFFWIVLVLGLLRMDDCLSAWESINFQVPQEASAIFDTRQ